MHQLGVYMKVVAKRASGGDVTLFDDEYSFEEQIIHRIDPVEMAAGDTVDVECTYENDTGTTVTFGDSSFSEMCFAGLLHYPPRNAGSFVCVR